MIDYSYCLSRLHLGSATSTQAETAYPTNRICHRSRGSAPRQRGLEWARTEDLATRCQREGRGNAGAMGAKTAIMIHESSRTDRVSPPDTLAKRARPPRLLAQSRGRRRHPHFSSRPRLGARDRPLAAVTLRRPSIRCSMANRGCFQSIRGPAYRITVRTRSRMSGL